MKQSEQLENQLRTIVERTRPVWPSENDEKIEVAILNWKDINLIVRLPDVYEQAILDGAIETAKTAKTDLGQAILETSDSRQKANLRKVRESYQGLLEICQLMLSQKRLIAIRRKTSRPSQYTLYVLARMSILTYVGFRCTLVESGDDEALQL